MRKYATFFITREGGFTLIELLVVMVIIGLLASIVVYRVLPRVDEAKKRPLRSK